MLCPPMSPTGDTQRVIQRFDGEAASHATLDAMTSTALFLVLTKPAHSSRLCVSFASNAWRLRCIAAAPDITMPAQEHVFVRIRRVYRSSFSGRDFPLFGTIAILEGKEVYAIAHGPSSYLHPVRRQAIRSLTHARASRKTISRAVVPQDGGRAHGQGSTAWCRRKSV